MEQCISVVNNWCPKISVYNSIFSNETMEQGFLLPSHWMTYLLDPVRPSPSAFLDANWCPQVCQLVHLPRTSNQLLSMKPDQFLATFYSLLRPLEYLECASDNCIVWDGFTHSCCQCLHLSYTFAKEGALMPSTLMNSCSRSFLLLAVSTSGVMVHTSWIDAVAFCLG